MKKINSDFLFPLLSLVVLIFALSQQMFKAPPIGKLLDPFIGIVQNEAGDAFKPGTVSFYKMGLKDTVQVFFDNREVPHIYAGNASDMYFAQGYVTAGLRLWQMDFLSYVSAGRLSEIFADGFLEYDRKQRRIGILEAAKTSLKMIEADPETSEALNAYTKGVNAYVQQLDYAAMPVEYKLLDYRPEPWTNLKSVLLIKYMANILSGYEEDYTMTNLMLVLGEEKFNRLFPDFPARYTPVSDSNYLPARAVSTGYIKKPAYLDYAFISAAAIVPKNDYNPKLGSNSWAVSGKKTASGFPILCSDPHLNLSLPATWLEMQLSAPGINVYGVTIPGTPAVIIGFNEQVAWGITNGIDDVKDWYKLRINADYTQYEFDGKWIHLPFNVEVIKRRGQETFYDTVYHTVHGPIVYSGNFDSTHPALRHHALKWELHRASNEFLTFIQLNKATNYTDYRAAIKHYASPVQNFTFACKDNTIAVNHQGSMAVKGRGEGRFILDGSSSEWLYTQYIPADSLPQQLNPASNYVLSANQHPTNPSYPYYYNGYYRENRANRIGQLLQQQDTFNVQQMEAMQLDNTSNFAVAALPVLAQVMAPEVLTVAEQQQLQKLGAWKGAYETDNDQPVFFHHWWKYIQSYTWDEFTSLNAGEKVPDDYILLDLISQHPADDYFDKQGTTGREKAADIVLAAFRAAIIKVKEEGSKKWGAFNNINIMHLANIKPFSTTNLATAGNADAINAVSSNAGPSWRMIVELGETPKAYGIYPGGQSGNPASAHFNDFMQDWNKGHYYPLFLYKTAGEARTAATHQWTLK
jgi:penicillin amidase